MPCLVPRPRLCSPRHSHSLSQMTSHPSSRDSGAGQQGTAEPQVTGPVPARNRGLPQVPGWSSKHTRIAWGTFEITEAPGPTPRDSVSQALGLPGWLAVLSLPVIGWAAGAASHCPKALSLSQANQSLHPSPEAGPARGHFPPDGSMDPISAGRQHISPGTGALPANTGSDLCSGSGGVCPGVRREPDPGDWRAFRAPSLRAEGGPDRPSCSALAGSHHPQGPHTLLSASHQMGTSRAEP